MILGFGVALGRSFVGHFVSSADRIDPVGLAWPYLVANLVLASIAFTIVFQARARDWPFICVAGCWAFFGAKLGVALLGPFAGPSLAALGLGVLSNVIARLVRQPAAVTLVPGLLLLVPGSVGFRSVTDMLDKDPIDSLESAFAMILIAAAIVSGLLLANVLMPHSSTWWSRRMS